MSKDSTEHEYPAAPNGQPEAAEEPELTLSDGSELPLSPSDVEAVWALQDDHAEQGELLGKMLAKKGKLTGNSSGENFRHEALQDYSVYNVVHAKSIGLSPQQAAVFHAIMQKMLDTMAPNNYQGEGEEEGYGDGFSDGGFKQTNKEPGLPMGAINPQDAMSASDCFKKFENYIRDHSVGSKHPIFLTEQAKLLTDFASMTLFKHYLLYQYLLYHNRETEVLRFEMNYEQPLPPPDLTGARLVRQDRRLKQGLGSTSGPTGGYQGSGQESAAFQPPADTPEVRDLTEEEEIDELVEAKLEEIRKSWKKKLEAREAAFHEKLEADKEAAAATKKK